LRGSAEFRRGRWRLDRQANLNSVISQELILGALDDFLTRRFPGKHEGSVLDLGAGARPYAPLYDSHFDSSTAVDVPESVHDIREVDVLASADDLPFADGSFDCVICTEMLEHCREPRAVMAEIARVLKAGGSAFVTTPFLLSLHEMPHDYFRYTPSALQDLAAQAGLSVASIAPRGGYGAVALGILLMPLSKAWYQLGKVTRLPLYNAYNPIVFATVLLPQLAYLAYWRHVRRNAGTRLARISARLTNHTPGYVTELEKPAVK
jgi:SAM-dependent methyltransferase